jgi:predicted ATPase
MLTKITIRNFKRFGEVEVELGNPVVFIGPNNSGKTSALQALALWEVGLKKWVEKRKGKGTPELRSGVTINRNDLVSVPVPSADLLWKDLHIRDVDRSSGKQVTHNVRIDIIVEGITEDKPWNCGLEFDYANPESFYCRPLRITNTKKPKRMPIPDEAERVGIAFLPPMSGLAANETRLDTGAINVRIGEGRTAEVLRNLCYITYGENKDRWDEMSNAILKFFGAELEAPQYITGRGEIAMRYKEEGISLDLSSSGKGLQQTLLLLAYMYANPGAVLLLDEPDAHLEILRQRQIYQLLCDVAQKNGNQVIVASHSEILLNEAAGRDVVVAFVGKKPHRIDDRGSQVLKALRDIGFDQYYQAEQTGWVLYLEGSTDLAALRAFAEKLDHKEAVEVLERPFVNYVGDQPAEVQKHFHGLREAVKDLKGIAIFDRLEKGLPDDIGPIALMWTRREIENYLCYPETLEEYAKYSAEQESAGPLFAPAESEKRLKAMKKTIKEIGSAVEKIFNRSPWDHSTKVSDDFLTPLFKTYFKKLGLYNIMDKKNFHELVQFVPKEKIDPEIKDKLDAIVGVAKGARPALEGQ